MNLEGRWQSFAGAARAVGDSRPGWKILRVLGNALGLGGFDYQSSDAVRDELRAAVDRAAPARYSSKFVASVAARDASTIDMGMYQIDATLRRAPSLQRTRAAGATA